MTIKEDKVRALIAEQAAEWFAANDAGSLDARQSSALVDWLKTSPVHVEELLRIATTARDLRELGTATEYSIDKIVARARDEDDSSGRPFWPRATAAIRDLPVRRWQAASVAMAAFAVVGLVVLGVWRLGPSARLSTPEEVTVLRFQTGHGQQHRHRLADNSVLYLNTDTVLTVHYSKTERRVELTAGEANLEVAHEPQRAFRVLAGSAEIVDLGTKFDVRLREGSTGVTVAEGQVAVALSSRTGQGVKSHGGQTTNFVLLGANQQISVVPAAWPATPVAVDAQSATSWLHREIRFDREPLELVAAEFNRYAPKPSRSLRTSCANCRSAASFPLMTRMSLLPSCGPSRACESTSVRREFGSRRSKVSLEHAPGAAQFALNFSRKRARMLEKKGVGFTCVTQRRRLPLRSPERCARSHGARPSRCRGYRRHR